MDQDIPVDYPRAPWQSRGGAWVGLFRADRPLALPPDLTPLLGKRWAVVALIRYLAGTLRYNECIVGACVRHGTLPGVYVEHIWVDSLPSLLGGRLIWGLPKQLARFTWRDTEVAISDEAGPITTLSFDTRLALLPRLPVPLPFFGCRDRRRMVAVATASSRLGRAGMRITAWSDRFAYRLSPTPILSVAMKPFRLTVPAPRVIAGQACAELDGLDRSRRFG